MLLLGIKHRQQQQADCLLVCAAMVLDYLGMPVDEARLRRRLSTTEDGTPFSNIERLQALGLFVDYAKHGDLSIFERYLEVGLPVIVGSQHWAGSIGETK